MSKEQSPRLFKEVAETVFHREYNLPVVIAPESPHLKKILIYKRLLAGIKGEGSFLLDDTYLQFDRYWDVEDQNTTGQSPKNTPYKIWAQASGKHQGKSIEQVWAGLADDETPLTLLEALSLLQQHPQVLNSLASTPLLVPATEALYAGTPGWYPCLKQGEQGVFVDLVTASTAEPNFTALTRKVEEVNHPRTRNLQ